MKYKGFIIDVKKIDEGGFSLFSHRESDGWILVDEWNPCVKTKQEAINECKITIDDYYENPDAYED